MHSFTASALFLSTLLVPALASYGNSASSSSASAPASTTTSSVSATQTIQVGKSGLVFSPDSVTAAQGSILEFHFTGSNLHDVVQGAFSSPCSDNNGIYSGYPSTSDVFQVTVNNTDPIWLYCSTQGHCQNGMVMVVNQASSGANTLDAYKSAAQSTSSSNAPANAQGGSVIAISALGASSSGGGGGVSSSASGSASATSGAVVSSSSVAASGAGETISNAFNKMVLVVGIPALAWMI